jgi:hypothetical protein
MNEISRSGKSTTLVVNKLITFVFNNVSEKIRLPVFMFVKSNLLSSFINVSNVRFEVLNSFNIRREHMNLI